MATIIDGYNVLFVAGIIGRGVGPGTLERARGALLNFVAAVLPADELRRTTVVFDARNPPPDRPRRFDHRGIDVRFAARYESADELIEILIRADSAPRKLLVVSSDHRVQRAARRRRAQTIDSDVWYDRQLEARRAAAHPEVSPGDDAVAARRARKLTRAEIEAWLTEFGGDDLLAATGNEAEGGSGGGEPDDRLKGLGKEIDDLTNPFPPGYAEDLDVDDLDEFRPDRK